MHVSGTEKKANFWEGFSKFGLDLWDNETGAIDKYVDQFLSENGIYKSLIENQLAVNSS